MEACIKGSQTKLIKQYFVEAFGPDAIDKVTEYMDNSEKEAIYMNVLDAAWVPYIEAFAKFLHIADRVLGDGDYKLCYELGVYLAQVGIPKFYKIFIQFGDPFFVAKRANKFYRSLLSTGRLEVSVKGKKSIRVDLHDYAYPNRPLCFLLTGYFKAVLQMCGVKNILSYEVKCVTEAADFCEFHLSWD